MCHKLNVSKMETIYKEIHCYLGEKDFAFLQSESILESDVIDDEAKELEDMEANAFAALLLAPKDRLEEQSVVYNLSYKNASVQVVLKIMDIFAIPYKAAVLRLFEEEKIEKKLRRNFCRSVTMKSVSRLK